MNSHLYNWYGTSLKNDIAGTPSEDGKWEDGNVLRGRLSGRRKSGRLQFK